MKKSTDDINSLRINASRVQSFGAWSSYQKKLRNVLYGMDDRTSGNRVLIIVLFILYAIHEVYGTNYYSKQDAINKEICSYLTSNRDSTPMMFKACRKYIESESATKRLEKKSKTDL